MKKILAVDDNVIERGQLESMLEKERGYEVHTAGTGRSALEKAERCPVDAVILDLRLPDMDGLEVLQKFKQQRPNLPVIMLTGFADIRTSVEAIRMGADDYLTKPFEDTHLLLTLQRVLERKDLLAEMEELRKKAGKKGAALSKILGKSPAIQEVERHIQKVADSTLTILIQGETGTGKEPTARALHEESIRRDRPFVAVDCGALPENLLESELFGHEKGAFSGADRKKQGQFELAEGGTLFLDEIGNLPFFLQAKLLRVLQERQVRPVGAAHDFPIQVRIVAASNTPLEAAVNASKFRQDLYYRLAEFVLTLPPLRQRVEDIPLLAQRFLEEAAKEFQRPVTAFTEGAVLRLGEHSWPGNVRELRNVVRQAVLLTPDSIIHEEQVRVLLETSSNLEAPGPLAVTLLPGMGLRKIVENAAQQVERQAITSVLRSTLGNKSQAAKALDVDYKTLRLKIKKYGLQFPDE
jgi:DNA-binding NtrC family response regulator